MFLDVIFILMEDPINTDNATYAFCLLASLRWFRLAVSVTLSSGENELGSRRTAKPSSTIASWICGG